MVDYKGRVLSRLGDHNEWMTTLSEEEAATVARLQREGRKKLPQSIAMPDAPDSHEEADEGMYCM